MRVFNKLLLFVILIGSTGCLYTFHPAYLPEDVVFNSELVGTWQDEGSDQVWSFQERGEKSYHVVLKSQTQETGPWDAHFFKLGEFLFLDLFPKEKEKEGFAENLLAPYHLIYKVKSIEKERFYLQILNSDWAENMIEERKLDVNYIDLDRYIKILTSSTDKNRELLLKYAAEAFISENDYSIKFKRIN